MSGSVSIVTVVKGPAAVGNESRLRMLKEIKRAASKREVAFLILSKSYMFLRKDIFFDSTLYILKTLFRFLPVLDKNDDNSDYHHNYDYRNYRA